MKVNRFDKFINEARIREDEFSHFNDRDDEDDDLPYDNELPYEYPEEDDDRDAFFDDSEKNDDLSDMFNLFIQLFNNRGIEYVEISGNVDEIVMEFNLNYREKLDDMINIFEVLMKINLDILDQYETTTDLWVNKKQDPLLTVTYTSIG